MSPIEITEDHEIILKEMIQLLFPQYKYVSIHEGTCDLCTPGTIDLHEEAKPNWNSWTRFNWFEFCLHICQTLKQTGNFPAIHDNFSYICMHYIFYNENNTKIHPINYLYSLTKEL